MRDWPQYEDLGLHPEADRTEDLRPRRKSDDPGAGTPRPSVELDTHHLDEEKF